MEPTIEVWNLDLIDGLEPAFVLGKPQGQSKKKKKGPPVGHTDAVIAVSWNKIYEYVIITFVNMIVYFIV